tara:strand:+ start:70 stop:351 length:282 start_codon:yes stop_codon:yes gene_type:complete
MIDNPLPNQIMCELDNLFINEKFEEHCIDRAKEIAQDNNLSPDYYDYFAEYYTELCRESDEGYFFCNGKDVINDWWDQNKYLYDDQTPYITIK